MSVAAAILILELLEALSQIDVDAVFDPRSVVHPLSDASRSARIADAWFDLYLLDELLLAEARLTQEGFSLRKTTEELAFQLGLFYLSRPHGEAEISSGASSRSSTIIQSLSRRFATSIVKNRLRTLAATSENPSTGGAEPP